MGSPLGPVLAGIFTVHLERSSFPLLALAADPSSRKQCVDDVITFIKIGTATHILSMLSLTLE